MRKRGLLGSHLGVQPITDSGKLIQTPLCTSCIAVGADVSDREVASCPLLRHQSSYQTKDG